MSWWARAIAVSVAALSISCAGARSAYGPRVVRVSLMEGFATFPSRVPPVVVRDGEALEKTVKLLDAHRFFMLDERYEPLPPPPPNEGGWCAIEAELSDGKTRRVTISNYAEADMCELLLEAYERGLRRPFCEVCRHSRGDFVPKGPLPPGELSR
jgi:hypothetical protein